MNRIQDEYQGHKIEIRRIGKKEELLIDDISINYGQLSNDLYFLDKYAYDWKDNLLELSRSFIKYRSNVERIRHERISYRGDKG